MRALAVMSHQRLAIRGPSVSKRAADDRQRGQVTSSGVAAPRSERERLVDRAAEEDGGQDHGRVHDDAGERAEHELARGLPEVGPHLPEVAKHTDEPTTS